MNMEQLIKELLSFVSASATQFQAVEVIADILKKRGFSELKEKERLEIKEGGKYYIIRDRSSIIAFRRGRGNLAERGLRIVGAHTDSPGLKIKPQPEKVFRNYLSLGVEVYGGPILTSWFDRDLSVAGRISYLGEDNKLGAALIDFRRPIAFVPGLAAHLRPRTQAEPVINKQKELPPIVAQFGANMGEVGDFNDLIKFEIKKTHPHIKAKEILSHDLWLYDTQAPVRLGYNREFISGPRLDNLLSCFAGARALADSDSDIPAALFCVDHEEVGSQSFKGAGGNFLKSTAWRLFPDREDFLRGVSQSILISADNAHGVHPNYQERHDENHGPILNRGPVIKVNANQRYATDAETGAFFKLLCRQAQVPVQSFVSRSDLPCGSTIGPAAAADLGVKALDIGLATFGMHSIREICGAADVWHLYRALNEFYKEEGILESI